MGMGEEGMSLTCFIDDSVSYMKRPARVIDK